MSLPLLPFSSSPGGRFAAFVVLWIFGQNVGIAIGYHRLLTHRGYAVPRWLEYVIATCGTMALQGGPIYWVGVHRLAPPAH